MDMVMKIGTAILLGAMIMMLIPRLKGVLQESAEAESHWPSFILPIVAVGGFVALLMWLV